jgi:hypothetical protein
MMYPTSPRQSLQHDDVPLGTHDPRLYVRWTRARLQDDPLIELLNSLWAGIPATG